MLNCEKTLVEKKYDVEPIDFDILEGECYLIHKNIQGLYVFRQVASDVILRTFPHANAALGFYFWAKKQDSFHTSFHI